MNSPMHADKLMAIRLAGQRPLGDIIISDNRRAIENADRFGFFALQARWRDDWATYDLSALKGLHVTVSLRESDPWRVAELAESVKRAEPKSVQVFVRGERVMKWPQY